MHRPCSIYSDWNRSSKPFSGWLSWSLECHRFGVKEHYLESCYPEKIMKLNVSKVAEERIEEGVALIAAN